MGKKSTKLAAAASAVDPTLDALFSGSFGPVQAPPKARYSEPEPQDERPKHETEEQDSDDEDEEEQDDDDEVLSEASQELDYDDDDHDDEEAEEDEDEASGSSDEAAAPAAEEPKRKRKRTKDEDNADLEGKYLSKLAAEDDSDNEASRAEKRQKKDAAAAAAAEDANADNEAPPQHESLSGEGKAAELEKADRTAFVANISSEAVSSKAAKKTLMAHLSKVLDAAAGERIESLRFRSVAFSTGSMPKKAAFITKQVMEATTKSTNAYVVYPSAAAVRRAAAELNGTEVLGRHVRVDSVSHPSPTDHRRCVFVGNLGFVDDESILEANEEGETVKKKRNKVPSDVEEGLWRTFSKEGRVENVRVVRDPKTRVGKGFAYVQFYDGNAVESALLLDGKKFPPMLPRALRVTRAKDPRKTNMAIERQREKLNSRQRPGAGAPGPKSKSTRYNPKFTPEQLSNAGRASKLLGKSGGAQQQLGRRGPRRDNDSGKAGDVDLSAIKTPQEIVFEGDRASSVRDARHRKEYKLAKKNKGKGFGRGGPGGGKPTHRGSRRAQEWQKKAKKE